MALQCYTMLLVLIFHIQGIHSLDLSLLRKRVLKPLGEVAMTTLLLSNPYDVSHSKAAFAATPVSLEQSVQNLEIAENRADALQAMADVFETSGTRSLQARTKYKQVIKCSNIIFIYTLLSTSNFFSRELLQQLIINI